METSAASASDVPTAPAAPEAPAAPANGSGAPAAAQPAADATTEAEPPTEFLRDLVSAMRSVAEESRQETINELKQRADEHVRRVQAASEERSASLRNTAETDIAGIGEWARAEAERIRLEADNRVAARRAQLEQQLGAESRRAEEEAAALRSRLSEYERELEAYHAQLSEINDPAAFAAAAKRIPRPPQLTLGASEGSAGAPQPATAANGAHPAAPAAGEEVEPEQPEAARPTEESLAGRLAELDAALAGAQPEPATPPEAEARPPAAQPPASSEGFERPEAVGVPPAETAAADEAAPAGARATAVIVKGLGSFGAITGFRQSLAAVEGIEGVSLSLGPTGEFVYRATHADGFDVAAAIRSIEGDGTTVESEADGTLRVTVSRGH